MDERSRRQQADAAEAIDQLRLRTAPSAVPFVGKTFSGGSYPTAVPRYYLVNPVRVGGTETERGAATATTTAETKRVFVLGPNVPPIGTYLQCVPVGGRWAARYHGTTTPDIIIPGCPCYSSPATLYMDSSAPLSNNHMFQDATLVYGPTPVALLPLGIGHNSYLSTTTFTALDIDGPFYYHFSCFIGYYMLSRVYITSLYGSPFRDNTRYRWPIGLSGNTCNPFNLHVGQIFAGGDPSCIVTIME